MKKTDDGITFNPLVAIQKGMDEIWVTDQFGRMPAMRIEQYERVNASDQLYRYAYRIFCKNGYDTFNSEIEYFTIVAAIKEAKAIMFRQINQDFGDKERYEARSKQIPMQSNSGI